MTSSQSYNDHGVRLLLDGDPAAASHKYREAIAADPQNATAHNNLGFAMACQGNHDAALVEYERALSLRPEDGTAQLNRGLSLIALDRPGEAVEAFAAAIDCDRTNVRAWEALADTCQRGGHFAEAARAWNAVVHLEPANLLAWQRLAAVLIEAEVLKEAETAIRNAQWLDTGNVTNHVLAGRLHWANQDFGCALQAFRDGLACDPDDAEARHALACVHLARGEQDLARDQLEKLLRLHPGDSRACVDLGVIALASGDLLEAVEQLESVPRTSPVYGKALYYLAMTYREAGRTEAFNAVLDRLLEREDDPYRPRAEDLANSAKVSARESKNDREREAGKNDD